MTLDECKENIGEPVVYRAPHVKRAESGERGVITTVNDRHVFVRYGSDRHSKATAPHLLTLVTEGDAR